MDVEPTIFVPARGMVNSEALRVDEAVREYDERLGFGMHEQNGDWIVYIKLPYWSAGDGYPLLEGQPIYPVLGFGRRIPYPDEVVSRLRKADTWEHGHKILNEMNNENIRLRRDAEEKANEAIIEGAERIEHAMRKTGMRGETHFFFPDRETN